ncbi:MAG: septum formation initiator family protein [Candidatus Cloacimonetes bacterium]|nr:septum formation initiator family protein [Candidatus Cloacimonadota bacterium]
MEKGKKIPIVSIGAIILILVWVVFFSEFSFVRKAKMAKKVRDYEKRIALAEQDNIRLQEENELLKNDPQTWEEEARKIGMQKDGEKIFIFREEDKK